MLKVMLSKKATKIDKIFTVDLTLCSRCQIDDEDFINFCGPLGKHEIYNGRNFEYNQWNKMVWQTISSSTIIKNIQRLIKNKIYKDE